MTTGRVGGRLSQLGNVALAYFDSTRYVTVTWVATTAPNNPAEFDFGTDEGGNPINLVPNVPTSLTHFQMAQAQASGAILLVMET